MILSLLSLLGAFLQLDIPSMAENPPDTTNMPLPIYGKKGDTTVSHPGYEKNTHAAKHLENPLGIELDETTDDLHKRAAIAVIQQQHTIPPTGKRMPTSKWEYIFFCIFCECSCESTTLRGRS